MKEKAKPPFVYSTFVRRAGTLVVSVATVFATTVAAWAASLVQISADPYTNASSQHATQVEPDTFAFGSTIIAAAQTGRFFDGGSSNIRFSTSTNGGASWVTGDLPGITKYFGSGPYDRVSDPAIAYDAKHNVWMISTLPLIETPSVSGVAVLTSRSTDGGLTWGNPVVVTNIGDVDKNWIACDNTPSSPFYGNCYTQWDEFSDGDRIYMSTSTDGGLTWGPRLKPANNATGLGGQPVVQPNGTVIVPVANANETGLLAFRSTNGGASWSSTVTIASTPDHAVAGNLRTGPLPSAEIDGAGKVFVVWQDCRFRRGCKSNDIVMSTSLDGVAWTAPVRIPIDNTSSKVDHFIPGLAVDRSTSGNTANLALTYYYYPNTNCSASTCQLYVGFITSTDGGTNWSAPSQLAGPMSLSWIANTSQGRMVGDYISTSFIGNTPFPAIAVATAPTGSVFNEAMFTVSGLAPVSGNFVVTAGADHPIPDAAADHANRHAPFVTR